MKNLLKTAVLTAVGTACIAGIAMAATPGPTSSTLIVSQGSDAGAYYNRTYTFYAQGRTSPYVVSLGYIEEGPNGSLLKNVSEPWPKGFASEGPFNFQVEVTDGDGLQAVPGISTGRYCAYGSQINLDVVTFSANDGWAKCN